MVEGSQYWPFRPSITIRFFVIYDIGDFNCKVV